MENSYIGLDPSYLHFGVSIINEDTKEVLLYDLGEEIDKRSTLSIYNVIPTITRRVKRKIAANSADNIFIGMEITKAYASWMASELYALDYAMYSELLDLQFNSKINLYSNAFLSSKLLGHTSSDKEATINLVEAKVFPILERHNYKIYKHTTRMTKFGDRLPNGRYEKRETITDGMADSIFYALKQLIKYSKDTSLVQEILTEFPVLETAKELS